MIQSKIDAFVDKHKNDSRESSESQKFWIDFFNIFSLDIESFGEFEYKIKDKFADYFWPGVLIIEQKSRGESLDKATEQSIERYETQLPARERPLYRIVCDFENFELTELKSNKLSKFKINELGKEIIDNDRFGFLSKHAAAHKDKERSANEDAVNYMIDIYNSFDGNDDKAKNVLISRILFCLFADDTGGIWDKNAFLNYVENTNADGTSVGAQLARLWDFLNSDPSKIKNVPKDLLPFEYVAGPFIGRNSFSEFSEKTRDKLIKACNFHWNEINPYIFGTMFESVKNKASRREMGAHYTSEENIMKTIRPLFLDNLRIELDRCKSARDLRLFHDKISKIKFMDPACGCGNFLVVAYREMRKLELKLLGRMGISDRALDIDFLCKISPSQFYGIEIEEFPAEISKTALWLMDHKMNLVVAERFGNMPKRIPLDENKNIVCQNALRTDWNEVIGAGDNNDAYIFGNPPFHGVRVKKSPMSPSQKQDMLAVAKGAKNLDLCAGWLIKGARFLNSSNGYANKEMAFVVTSGVFQGRAANKLNDIVRENNNIHINEAHNNFKWSSESKNSADVNVSIVVASAKNKKKKTLHDYSGPHVTTSEPKNINFRLHAAPDLIPGGKIKILDDNCPKAYKGLGTLYDDGNYELSATEFIDLIKTNQEIKSLVRPYTNANAYLSGISRHILWAVDTNNSLDISKLSLIKHKLNLVKEFRESKKAKDSNITDSMISNPLLHSKKYKYPKNNYCLIIPTVTTGGRSLIPVGFINSNVICSETLVVVDTESLVDFGILQSEMHYHWAKKEGGGLRDNLRYTMNVFNTFPWPNREKNIKLLESIEGVSAEILNYRESLGLSLKKIYSKDRMDNTLSALHGELNKIVDDLYKFNSKNNRYEFLLNLYNEKAKNILKKDHKAVDIGNSR